MRAGIILFLIMSKVQILYPYDGQGNIRDHFLEEATEMSRHGFLIGAKPIEDADIIIYRGFAIYTPENYPQNDKMIQSWEANRKTLSIYYFYPIIEEDSIPTVFVDELTEAHISKIAKSHGWDRVFIKSPARSLFCVDDYASVWPDTPINKMVEYYDRMGHKGPFAVRKYIDNPQIFYDEQRYWVLEGVAYHPSGIIPDFVQKNAKKIYEFSGSHYFTIDVAGDYIVEVNPGESSDRGGENPLEFFCEIFAKTFLNK